jgi:hypothetical protein
MRDQVPGNPKHYPVQFLLDAVKILGAFHNKHLLQFRGRLSKVEDLLVKESGEDEEEAT